MYQLGLLLCCDSACAPSQYTIFGWHGWHSVSHTPWGAELVMFGYFKLLGLILHHCLRPTPANPMRHVLLAQTWVYVSLGP